MTCGPRPPSPTPASHRPPAPRPDAPTETRTSVSYALTTTVRRSFADTLDATRASLTDQGFGVLTEIDIQATMKAKLDVDVPAKVMVTLTQNEALSVVADEAGRRLAAALDTLTPALAES